MSISKTKIPTAILLSVVTPLSLFLFLLSCTEGNRVDQFGLTELQVDSIEKKIHVHNAIATLTYKKDLLKNQESSELMGAKFSIDSFNKAYFSPYSVTYDTSVSYEKYGKYCLDNKFNALTYIDEMTKKAENAPLPEHAPERRF